MSGTNTVKSMGAKGRKDALAFDPEDVKLITDPNHPLYDERVHEEPSPEFVANIDHLGIIEPITVRRNGDVVEVAIGRRRVKAARIANVERRKKGLPPHQIYAIVQRGDDATMQEVIAAENEARKNDSPMNRAKKMQRLATLGRTEEQIACVFCCSRATVKNTLALLDLDETVQKAVERGTIKPVFAAKELARLPREEQRTKLKSLVDAGATKGEAAKGAIRQLNKGEAIAPRTSSTPRPRLPSYASVEAFAEALRKREKDTEYAILRFLLGHPRALDRFSELKGAAKEAGL